MMKCKSSGGHSAQTVDPLSKLTYKRHILEMSTSPQNDFYRPNTHTHTRLTALFPGLPGRASTRKVKPIWILLEQETVSGSGISWTICKSASRSRQITMPAPHRSSFFTGQMPFLPPNQQRQSTEGTWLILTNKTVQENTDKQTQYKSEKVNNLKPESARSTITGILPRLKCPYFKASSHCVILAWLQHKTHNSPCYV